MKNIFITQGVYIDKNKSLYFKTDLNWINYAKKHKFNLVQINNIQNLYNKKIDGIIFSGGNDLSKIKKNKENLYRDKLEKKILNFAKKKTIPYLFVCRGMQFLADHENIKLKKDKTKKHVNKYHKINIGKKLIKVNSYHNYIITRSNNKFKNLAFDENDKSIEIMKHKNFNFLAIMFHPERSSPDQNNVNLIFRNFFNL